jgi:prepilin-type N-terminal cleavage/methylation domain-containing protein
MTHASLPPRPRAGFTLVEVAVALSILVLIVVPLAASLAAVGAQRADTESSLRIATFAANRLEALRLQGLDLASYESRYGAEGQPFQPDPEEVTGLLVSDLRGTIRAYPAGPALSNALVVEVEILYVDERGHDRRAFVSTVLREELTP